MKHKLKDKRTVSQRISNKLRDIRREPFRGIYIIPYNRFDNPNEFFASLSSYTIDIETKNWHITAEL
jgi:hypothetical protein